jgi:uncharacterized protein (DUF2141 family)
MASGAGLALFPAFADSLPTPDPFARLASPDAVVLAVQSGVAPGGHVRLAVYNDPARFLEAAAGKFDATVNDEGLALVTLTHVAPGEYAFVAYLDENGDGRLNRNLLGQPKEPFGFSNDVKPKLRKPTFEEAKVAVAPGEVVVLTLDD